MGGLVTVQMDEQLARGAAVEARARVAAVAGGADALVEAVRVRVGRIGDGTVLAQVNAEVNGRRIRVQETAADLGEALDRLADGLRGRIAAVTAGWSPRPWPRRVRGRGLAATAPAPQTPRPLAEVPCDGGSLSIVRRKRVDLVRCSPDAAARTMDAMDFDIHLFTDPVTGTDAVVYRVGPTGYRLARTAAAGPPLRPAVPFTLSPCGAPELTEERAVGRLSAAELPFLFFAHPATGRGRVLYRRFDGRLGLIVAAS
ncbi:sigma 54 modulation/S30EA ribosomal C-terminal domain-containing protein [Kitasatospora sp. CM 4170]|uniref:Sigma 54 modulation/S30EA ribosomal C-terminal domain-containing protein n=2 Tax=Kitasatospora aburaviensis TaxID=67265 RepID=A0ABW1F594_9ACTN|nr:sigma 54 modulation/S30EA ribosomal C-terminal domain-containing protein [Kitasatospora sp. CM 4170]WNM44201.1 sigma 54 modulation/S30EA ribosomal C-terminal domain-containing protein [Kitasatospora sp. CM 4170]